MGLWARDFITWNAGGRIKWVSINVAIATKCFGLMNHLKTKTYVKIVKCGFKMKENTMVSYSKIPIGQSRHPFLNLRTTKTSTGSTSRKSAR